MAQNQTNSPDASMASWNNKAQQHHHKETVRELAIKVAAELGLFVAVFSLVLVVTFSDANLSAMCFSDNSTVNNERSLGKYTEALMNLLCPVLELINQHVSMSNLVPLIELFSFLVIIWAVAVLLLLGAKFTSLHLVMFLIWSILMLQGSHMLTIGLYLITLGLLLFMSSSWKKQSPNGMEKMQQKRERKS